ncbi:hypothetical protein [Afipia sp. DC4300-2b1]|uniref:hypothetical protein n=1 Tax=Afipia sp. DC4300-2b1 TaxID=2804672 RepID=UPI003CEF4638
MLKFAKQDFTLGALFKLGARRKFDRETLVRLMIERGKLSEKSAHQLAHHWLGTEPYRSTVRSA